MPLVILSRAVLSSAETEYSHADDRKSVNSPSRLRSDSEQDSTDPSADLDGKLTLPSDNSNEAR